MIDCNKFIGRKDLKRVGYGKGCTPEPEKKRREVRKGVKIFS